MAILLEAIKPLGQPCDETTHRGTNVYTECAFKVVYELIQVGEKDKYGEMQRQMFHNISTIMILSSLNKPPTSHWLIAMLDAPFCSLKM